jgi:hypothetical protein
MKRTVPGIPALCGPKAPARGLFETHLHPRSSAQSALSEFSNLFAPCAGHFSDLGGRYVTFLAFRTSIFAFNFLFSAFAFSVPHSAAFLQKKCENPDIPPCSKRKKFLLAIWPVGRSSHEHAAVIAGTGVCT